MGDEQPTPRPTQLVAQRVRALRQRHGWSAERLAQEMQQVGIPWERMVVSKLENGRRATVSVDELLALAYVLSVVPVHLLVPTEGEGAYEPVPGLKVRPDIARSWIRGKAPIGKVDVRRYATEIPLEEFGPDAHGLVSHAQLEAELARRANEAGLDVVTERDDLSGMELTTDQPRKSEKEGDDAGR